MPGADVGGERLGGAEDGEGRDVEPSAELLVRQQPEHAVVAHQHLGPVGIERRDHLRHRRQRVQRRRARRPAGLERREDLLGDVHLVARGDRDRSHARPHAAAQNRPKAGRGRDREVLDAVGEQAAEAARAGGRADVEAAQVAPDGGGLDVRLDAGQAERRIARDLVPMRHERGLRERRQLLQAEQSADEHVAVVRRALDRVVDQRAQAVVLVGEELIARPAVARHQLGNECARVHRGGHGATASRATAAFASGGGSWSFPARCSRALTPSLR